MPWLADLVQSSEGSLDVLPVQCLCEFLLHDAADDSLPIEDDDEAESKEQKAKKRQVCFTPYWNVPIFEFFLQKHDGSFLALSQINILHLYWCLFYTDSQLIQSYYLSSC